MAPENDKYKFTQSGSKIQRLLDSALYPLDNIEDSVNIHSDKGGDWDIPTLEGMAKAIAQAVATRVNNEVFSRIVGDGDLGGTPYNNICHGVVDLYDKAEVLTDTTDKNAQAILKNRNDITGLRNEVAGMRIELSDYATEGAVLPTLNASFLYDGMLTHHRTIYDVNCEISEGVMGYYHVFCAEHDREEKPDVIGVVYFVYDADLTFYKLYDARDEVVPDIILRAFGEAVATEDYNGLMSAEDKKKLDGIPEGGGGAKNVKGILNINDGGGEEPAGIVFNEQNAIIDEGNGITVQSRVNFPMPISVASAMLREVDDVEGFGPYRGGHDGEIPMAYQGQLVWGTFNNTPSIDVTALFTPQYSVAHSIEQLAKANLYAIVRGDYVHVKLTKGEREAMLTFDSIVYSAGGDLRNGSVTKTCATLNIGDGYVRSSEVFDMVFSNVIPE